MTDNTPSKNPLRSILASPLFTSIASIASVVGLLLTIYYAHWNTQSPELTFSINPVKLEVVSAGQTSKLSVSFDGKAVGGDITTTQVAVWNHGNSPIRRSDILRPIVIYTDPRTPILEASVRKTSRDVIGFSVSPDEVQRGRIPISWEILEQGDGGLIEIIYAGSPEINFKVEGAVVGQKEIIRYDNRIGFQSPAEKYEALHTRNRRIRVIALPLAAITMLGFIFTILKIFRHESKHRIVARRQLVVAAVWLVIMAGILVWMFVLSKYPIPPPGL